MSSRIYALGFHADYQCRHSGACCSADWDVPVELPVFRSLSALIERQTLTVAPTARGHAPFIADDDLPDGAAAMLERTERGECVFYDTTTHLCVVHRDCGEASLPATCRHFPRLAVRDARGTSISLSHFCPTAASMLFEPSGKTEIVEAPRAFPPAEYEGLEVSGEDLPPLLTPAMLMDIEGYAAWERHMVERCATDASPESVVATLVRDARTLRTWKPGGRSLAEAVVRLPPDTVDAALPETLAASLGHHAAVMAAVPDDLRPPFDDAGLETAYDAAVRPQWASFGGALNRYVAAKAFASWTAYQGKGVSTIVRGLDAALSLVRVEASRQCRDHGRRLDAGLLLEAIRAADFALNHLAVGEDLARSWNRAEEE